MRFFDQSSSPATLAELEKAMIAADPGYSLVEGTLNFNGQPYAQISINTPDDDVFDEEIEEQIEFLEDMTGDVKAVKKVLKSAQSIVAAQILFGSREVDEVLSIVSPLWAHLHETRDGLLQCDDEGFYDKNSDLIASE